ncbi:threonine dehydrogenase-like Zn-dependent dehydrogenase [Thermosporothrix hazakensis]|jgi:threonine dehydrogenase-like Zn-dependent dehydrogenase|uniref:Threonine dehydrogenase-like Zn-dependent dehydrogenase n=2 Tax=Thermosporothrix TaxID=768650 RepID=A0A326U6B5_THEHA|nr:zinc-dependent alcohol dehydrogenase [Thermosporothrix hazakensis]PZW29440.1 threonine dehydrogenase-like Zn-dependent dehydrogenase [Thermosporothrix hazakensis]BBH85726.1 glutathione-dependent formaldehyde dehydrogenase [Thermosporothrix sp. COM3]GCE45845.1 glutathione-dependent formaldehyde dehydrogenase [Thermosporothrix hazakensis]
MRAVCWNGITNVQIERVPDPQIINPRDAIVKVTATTICGSDLHLYDGYIPTMQKGDVIGHEFMGEVVEVGKEVKTLRKGDRVVVPSVIACGKCYYCRNNLWSLCDNSNPNAWMAEAMYGFAPAGIYGYSHLYGGYGGSHAEYVRVPFADIGPVKVPDGVSDEQALFISDAFPTGYTGADYCDIKPGDTVAVWGCGAVGLFAMISARMLGAEQVIAIDRFPERLRVARDYCHAVPLNYEGTDVVEELKQMTGGRGPDACIDAVGMEAHGPSLLGLYDKVRQTVRLTTDRATAVRQAIQACRKGGVVSIMGVYGGFLDKFPLGAAFTKGLTLRMSQMHAQRYTHMLMERVAKGEVDPTFVVTHRMSLDEAAQGFELFKHKEDECLRVVFRP